MKSVCGSDGKELKGSGHLRWVVMVDSREWHSVSDVEQIVEGITVIPQWEESDNNSFVAADYDDEMVDDEAEVKFKREGTTGLVSNRCGRA